MTFVDATANAGFLHVKTEDDQVGWVYAKYVSVSAAPAPTVGATNPSAASGAQCDANLWNHVLPSPTLDRAEAVHGSERHHRGRH